MWACITAKHKRLIVLGAASVVEISAVTEEKVSSRHSYSPLSWHSGRKSYQLRVVSGERYMHQYSSSACRRNASAACVNAKSQHRHGHLLRPVTALCASLQQSYAKKGELFGTTMSS